MSAGVRKFALTLHVVVSVGSMGAVGAFVALAAAGRITADENLARAAYPAMEVTAWFVIVPLIVASLLTGIVQSLGTTWGLFRHYWVLMKLVLTTLTTLVLLIHMQPIRIMADVVAHPPFLTAEHRGLQAQLLAAAVSGLLVLLLMTVLSVYKPRGVTRHGWRVQQRA